jgi:peroxin-3
MDGGPLVQLNLNHSLPTMSVQPTAQPSFFARHRNKFLYTLGTLSTLYLGGQWVSSKLSEMNERASLERTARENLRKRFEQNQADVGFTTMALLPDLGEK